MKKQTLQRKINEKISYWKEQVRGYNTSGVKKASMNWLIAELKSIKIDVDKLDNRKIEKLAHNLSIVAKRGITNQR